MSRLERPEGLLVGLGAAVAKRRMELHLSQDELANKAGIHRTYVSDVERGLRNVSILTLERIAQALDIHVSALLIVGSQPVFRSKNV